MALCESAADRHTDRQDRQKRYLIANGSPSDRLDRQGRRRFTPLHKDPWRSAQNAITSPLDRQKRHRSAT